MTYFSRQGYYLPEGGGVKGKQEKVQQGRGVAIDGAKGGRRGAAGAVGGKQG